MKTINYNTPTFQEKHEADEDRQTQLVAEIQNQELLACQTGLVRMLIDIQAPGGFTWDDVTQSIDLPIESLGVVEWWLVTPWLANELSESGEIVLANEFGQWWGCRHTKIGAFDDGALRAIAWRMYVRTKNIGAESGK